MQSRKRIRLPGDGADDGNRPCAGVLDLERETSLDIFLSYDSASPPAATAHDDCSLVSISNGSRVARSIRTAAPDNAHHATTRSTQEFPTKLANGRDSQTLRQLRHPTSRPVMVPPVADRTCRNTPQGPSSRAMRNETR